MIAEARGHRLAANDAANTPTYAAKNRHELSISGLDASMPTLVSG